MKKIIYYFLITILICSNATAQIGGDNGNRKDQVEKIIVAYITKKLDLTVEEAQQFWPVFNKYQAEYRMANKNNKDDVIGANEAELAVQKKYKPEFQRVLKSEVRANKVFVVHNNLLTEMKRLKNRRQGDNNDRPRLQRRSNGGGNIGGNGTIPPPNN